MGLRWVYTVWTGLPVRILTKIKVKLKSTNNEVDPDYPACPLYSISEPQRDVMDVLFFGHMRPELHPVCPGFSVVLKGKDWVPGATLLSTSFGKTFSFC